MAETDSLAAATRAAGKRATEAFAALGNETRLAILLALWEAGEPGAGATPVPFSALAKRVGVDDTGGFNYHLRKLEGRFIRRTDEGYVLRRAGGSVVRAIIAGVGVEEPTMEPARVDETCPLCGAGKELRYADEQLYFVCTGCEGAFGGREDLPRGTLSAFELDPAGLTDRTPEEIAHAAWAAGTQHIQAAIEGVCNECSGPIEGSLSVCDDHDPEGLCATCGRSFELLAEFRCPVCKNYHGAPPRTIVAGHPAVVAFYHERGVPFQYETGDFASLVRRADCIRNHEEELLATDPPRVRVTVRDGDDALALTLDGELNVVEIAD